MHPDALSTGAGNDDGSAHSECDGSGVRRDLPALARRAAGAPSLEGGRRTAPEAGLHARAGHVGLLPLQKPVIGNTGTMMACLKRDEASAGNPGDVHFEMQFIRRHSAPLSTAPHSRWSRYDSLFDIGSDAATAATGASHLTNRTVRNSPRFRSEGTLPDITDMPPSSMSSASSVGLKVAVGQRPFQHTHGLRRCNGFTPCAMRIILPGGANASQQLLEPRIKRLNLRHESRRSGHASKP